MWITFTWHTSKYLQLPYGLWKANNTCSLLFFYFFLSSQHSVLVFYPLKSEQVWGHRAVRVHLIGQKCYWRAKRACISVENIVAQFLLQSKQFFCCTHTDVAMIYYFIIIICILHFWSLTSVVIFKHICQDDLFRFCLLRIELKRIQLERKFLDTGFYQQ